MPNHRLLLVRSLLCTVALAWLAMFAGAQQPAESGGRFEVHDVGLWILDPGSKMANPRAMFPSALPVTVPSLRESNASRDARRVAPISMITFHGEAASEIDVDLRSKSATFLAHWPPGESLPNRLRWSGQPPFDLVKKIEDDAELVFVDDDHWFTQARQGDALYVKRGARSERFLAYDAELGLDPPLRLEGGPDKYKVINNTDTPLYDVLISRATPEGRRVAWIDVLPTEAALKEQSQPKKAEESEPKAAESKPAAEGDATEKLFVNEAPAAQPPAAQSGPQQAPQTAPPKQAEKKAENKEDNSPAPAPAAKPAAQLFGGLPKQVQAKLDAAAPKKPGTQLFGGLPKDVEAKLKKTLANKEAGKPKSGGLFGGLPSATSTSSATGVEVTLSAPLPIDSPEAAAQTVAALSERLTNTGLAAQEVELFLAHYGPLFFEDEALVVGCRLDPAAIDEKVALSVFPLPTKTVRVAMVLVRNADPQMGDEIERLIAQLGDTRFARREAAQKRLLELGPLAFPSLNKALANDDLEVVIRAERILLQQNQTPNAPARADAKPAVRGIIRAAPAVIINR